MSALMAARAAAPPAGKKETPSPLSNNEKALAGLLIVAGVVIVTVVLAIFLTDGQWLTEETTTTGDGATKKVETKKYSDSLPLAALGVGGLLVLCGAFFGRLREITLPGGAGIKLGDAKEEVEEKVEQKADEKAQHGEVDPAKLDELKRTARREASVLLLEKVTAGTAPPPQAELESIAEQAVEHAKGTL